MPTSTDPIFKGPCTFSCADNFVAYYRQCISSGVLTVPTVAMPDFVRYNATCAPCTNATAVCQVRSSFSCYISIQYMHVYQYVYCIFSRSTIACPIHLHSLQLALWTVIQYSGPISISVSAPMYSLPDLSIKLSVNCAPTRGLPTPKRSCNNVRLWNQLWYVTLCAFQTVVWFFSFFIVCVLLLWLIFHCSAYDGAGRSDSLESLGLWHMHRQWSTLVHALLHSMHRKWRTNTHLQSGCGAGLFNLV